MDNNDQERERWITIQEIFSTIESPDIVQEQSENIICFKKKWKQYLTLVYAKWMKSSCNYSIKNIKN